MNEYTSHFLLLHCLHSGASSSEAPRGGGVVIDLGGGGGPDPPGGGDQGHLSRLPFSANLNLRVCNK